VRKTGERILTEQEERQRDATEVDVCGDPC